MLFAWVLFEMALWNLLAEVDLGHSLNVKHLDESGRDTSVR